MSDTDFIPNTYLNKSQIADKYSMSRVTVNKHLKKLETEGRLFPKTVQQGGRKLYWYDPNDLDVAFESIAKGGLSKRNVKHSVSGGFNVQNQLQIELLRKDIELEQKLRIKAEEEVADLKQQRSKQDQQIQFLQTQITDQRSVVLPEVSGPVTEEVVPPKTEPEPSTIADIKEAMVDADRSNDGLKDVAPEEQPDTSIMEEKKRIYFEKTGKDIPPIRTQKDYDEYRKIVGSDYEIMHGLDQRYLNDGDQLSKAKDVAPEEQPKPLPSPPTLNINEAVEDWAEKEARRDNIAPKAEPQQYEKPKGLWAWLKGY